MAKRYRIIASKPDDIQSVSKRIYLVGRGYADVSIGQDGDIIIVPSNPYVSDGMVKRDPKYKDVISELSDKIWDEYVRREALYKAMHSVLKKTIYSKASYERKVDQIERKRYIRRSFTLPKPTSTEATESLRVEANAIYHKEEASKKRGLISEFINKRLSQYLIERQDKWNEAKALFDEIETAIEQKENAAHDREYQRQRQEALDFVNGAVSVFEPQFDKMIAELKFPFSFDLDYTYIQYEGRIRVNVTLLNGVEIPLEKAVKLSSGRLSIKNKLVREIDQDTTETILSFMYFLTARIFGVSPNLSVVEMTIWESGKNAGLCWVEFIRDSFARNISPSLEPITDVQSYNRVLDLRVRNGASTIYSIARDKFEKKIKEVSGNAVVHEQSYPTVEVNATVKVEPPRNDSRADNISLNEDIYSLLLKSQRMEAYKLYSKTMKVSLAEARDAVNEILKTHVLRLLKSGQKLEAVKLHQKGTGLTLQESKAYVDRLIQDEAKATDISESDTLSQRLHKLILRGDYIQAIKEYKEASGLGLKDAKDYIDRLRVSIKGY